MSYTEFQNQPSSEKITLAILHASQRLMGWTLHSGSVYKLENIDVQAIVSLEDSGTPYTQVADLVSVVASSYYYDRDTKTLYLITTGSDNPNGRFLILTFKLFFANSPIILPHDLGSGYEVFFEPSLQSTSQFGVEIDTINQTSEAIEGNGTLTLRNDGDDNFWRSNFDKLYFDNHRCLIYSHNRELEANEAKLIFSGRIEKRTFNQNTISFALRDILSELRAPIALGTISDLGLRTGDDLAQSRQRLIIGRVFGHVPVNTDQVLDGYPITGTVSISYNSATLTGSGTDFLTQLSPDDRIVLDGAEYTIATVSSATSATITENYPGTAGVSGATAYIIPEEPKRWINRTWHIAGHALREPQTTIVNGSSITRIIVQDATDIYAGDWIYIGPIGAGELIQVESTTGTRIVNLRTSLATIPPVGTLVTRPAVQNVRIDDVPLVYYTDYTLNASTATLTLRNTAESNASPTRHLTSNLSFTSGSRTATGSGLKNIIKPGYMVGVAGNAVFFEVLSVDSETQLTLRSASTFTANTAGRYKALIYDPSKTVLSLDVLGKTEDGTTSGTLLKTAPSIVKALLQDAGLTDSIETDSFTDADAVSQMHIGLVAPFAYTDTDAPAYRDVINKINKSVFGSLIQTTDFKLAYHILEPNKSTTALRLDESDILGGPSFESTSEKVIKTSIVKYRQIEYDYLVKKKSYRTQQKTSDIATHVAKSAREKTFETYLVEEADAERMACRWAFILEHGAGRATIRTKLQAMQVEVGSIVEISHRKFFERIGLTLSARLFLVEAVKKTGSEVQLELVDLSNAFARVASINTLTNTFETATEREKLYGGFITDQYGLIGNNPESFGINLIW